MHNAGDIAPRDTSTSLVHRVYYIDNFLVELISQLFSSADQLPQGLKDLRAYDDSSEGVLLNNPRGIQVQQWGDWDPANAGNLPLVLVKGNDINFQRVGIGDRHINVASNPSGMQRYSKLAVGSHRVLCISNKPHQSHLIALEISDHLHASLPVALRHIGLLRAEVQGVGSPKRFRELPHSFASTVNLEYGFYQQWTVTPAAPRLNRVDIKLSN